MSTLSEPAALNSTAVNPIAVNSPTVHVRVKLSALWASVMFCDIYADYFSLWQPGYLDGMAGGEGALSSPGVLLAAYALMAIPSVMIFLPLVLPTRTNRWVNIVLGVAYTVVIAVGMPGAWLFYILFNVIEIALTLTVVVVAWRESR